MTNDKGRVAEKGECSERKQKGEGGNDGFFLYILQNSLFLRFEESG